MWRISGPGTSYRVRFLGYQLVTCSGELTWYQAPQHVLGDRSALLMRCLIRFDRHGSKLGSSLSQSIYGTCYGIAAIMFTHSHVSCTQRSAFTLPAGQKLDELTMLSSTLCWYCYLLVRQCSRLQLMMPTPYSANQPRRQQKPQWGSSRY